MMTSHSEKTCNQCGEVKPRTEFYRHPNTADGLLGSCKDCKKSDVSANYAVKREHYSAYNRKRYQESLR